MASREQLFKRINNALLDMQASTYQTFEQHFLTFARLLADSSLQSLNQRLIANLDVELFLNESSKTQGSMVGSARLAWPVDVDEVLGLKWLLIQKLAREPGQILNFAHTFYTVGRNLSGELHSLARQLLIPFGRDYKDFVMTEESLDGASSGALANSGEVQRAAQHITYNISGSNARVNNHSTDNSVNTVVVNSEVSNQIQALRNEIQRAMLTAAQKSEAGEVVDEIEAQIASGKPKKGVVSALLASLPAVQSITAIGKTL
ncbi:hypothetical protein WAE56_14650 [Iodobacter sp. LRB]|uniref:hypothetical protein n=1 Tax=Iodobacter sp. LRB TaxID=3127955 RepID=UPI00307CFCF2